ncbi:MAG: DNA-binding protein [Bacteroidia bacterium]|nr:MAG: DNA-binding protein [Bacteroidia bacterium]
MDGLNKNTERERDEIFSKAVRAGKRTYFFDVKATRKNDYYLTITESKKRYDQDGNFRFEKHKLFLYKEDFEKFTEGLQEVVQYIRMNKGYEEDVEIEQENDKEEEETKEIKSEKETIRKTSRKGFGRKSDFDLEPIPKDLKASDLLEDSYSDIDFDDLDF